MTLGEAKNRVYMLLDEHSAGGVVEHDPDIELKMTNFFDICQKQLAQLKKIIRIKKISTVAGKTEYAMPDDFMGLCRIWRDGVPVTGRYAFRGNKVLIPERDFGRDIQVEYFAIPETIDPDAGDDYEFELPEDACSCMPYYVAAQQLLPDLVMDYGAMLTMYQLSVQQLSTGIPGSAGRLYQTLFRA